MYNYIIKCIGLTITLAFCCIHTIQGQITFKHLTVADGLHSNQVRQIIELPNGQILAVTEGMFNLVLVILTVCIPYLHLVDTVSYGKATHCYG